MKKILLKIGLPIIAVLAVLGFIFTEQIKTLVIDQFLASYLGELPTFSHKAGAVSHHRVKMRDGTLLYTRVHSPEGPGPWPTLLVRDPYQFSYYLTCHLYVRYGYACVHQDVRGQGESEGEWYPIKYEANDGLDTLDWLIKQKFHNGKLATVGASYVGLVQWAMADQFPPEVKTMVASVSHGDFYSMVYRGGHFTQAIAGIWSAEIFRPLSEKAEGAEIWKREVMPVLPASSVDAEIFQGAWSSYQDFISHPDILDPYWQQPFYTQLRNAHKKVQVPTLLIARWHDFFVEGTLKNYQEMPSQKQSVLMISPGEHGGNTGDLEVSNEDQNEFHNSLYWFDHHLRGAELPQHLRSEYLYYLNGADQWKTAKTWPPSNTSLNTLHLSNLGQAESCGGKLLAIAPKQTTPANYKYDPANPTPTAGGAFLLNPALAPVAVSDQGTIACERADVLSFKSQKFEIEQRIAGSISINIKVSTNVDDTAFSVKISEIKADGRVLNIRDDITSLAYRNGINTAQAYIRNSKVSLQFTLPPIDWTLAEGSALRLDISSSNAPAFAPHSNHAGVWSEIESYRIAEQTLYSGQVELPFVAD